MIPHLSIIVPMYNEFDRMREPLLEIGEYFSAQCYASEIVLVNDGSADETLALACELAPLLGVPTRVFHYGRNRGKGYALKAGFAQAQGERILFTDIDLSTPIEYTARLLNALDSGAGIAIGTRKLPHAEVTVHQPWYRESMGRVFTALVRVLFTHVSDVTCGFKLFEGRVGRDIFSRVRVFDWSFDAEVLWIARDRSIEIQEVPVRWEDKPGTQVRLLQATIFSLFGLGRILINSYRGRYEAPAIAEGAELAWPRLDKAPATQNNL